MSMTSVFVYFQSITSLASIVMPPATWHFRSSQLNLIRTKGILKRKLSVAMVKNSSIFFFFLSLYDKPVYLSFYLLGEVEIIKDVIQQANKGLTINNGIRDYIMNNKGISVYLTNSKGVIVHITVNKEVII